MFMSTSLGMEREPNVCMFQNNGMSTIFKKPTLKSLYRSTLRGNMASQLIVIKYPIGRKIKTCLPVSHPFLVDVGEELNKAPYPSSHLVSMMSTRMQNITVLHSSESLQSTKTPGSFLQSLVLSNITSGTYNSQTPTRALSWFHYPPIWWFGSPRGRCCLLCSFPFLWETLFADYLFWLVSIALQHTTEPYTITSAFLRPEQLFGSDLQNDSRAFWKSRSSICSFLSARCKTINVLFNNICSSN